MPLIKVDGKITHIPSDVRIGYGPSLGDSTQRRDYLRLANYDFIEAREQQRLAIVEGIIGWGCALGLVVLVLWPHS